MRQRQNRDNKIETNKNTETMNRQNNETRRTVLRRTAGRTAVAVLLAACMLASGCAKEFEEVTGGAGGGKRIEVSFDVPQMDEVRVETRMAAENILFVENLWVIQLNEAGTALLQPSIYISKVLDNRVNLDLTDQRSMIIFIANTFDETLFSGATTAAQVAAVAKSFSTYDEFIAAPDYLSYRFKGMPDELKGNQIKMVRSCARIDVKVECRPSSNEVIALRSVRFCNVPKTVHFYRDPDKLDPGTTASATYPATTSGFIGEWKRHTVEGSWYEWTCYLPENGRGKGTATRQEDKTAAKALGGASGQGNYATYIEITAAVTLADGTAFKDVKYRVYLGGDAVSDYTIKRNTRYTVTCTLRGVNKLDARVTVGTPTYPGDYYDYTDNRTGRFLIAKSDATNGTAVNWNAGQKLCKDGWRLPTAAEIGMSATLAGDWWKNYYGFKSQWYHTSSFNGATSNQRFAFNYSSWSYGTGPTSDNAHVRCVKDLPSDGKKYPYVTTNSSGQRNVIVLREGNNGVNTSALRDNINATVWSGSYTDKSLRLPRKLQISEKSLSYDYWKKSNVASQCANYREGGYTNWRIPNARDLMLLRVMSGEMDFKLPDRVFINIGKSYTNGFGVTTREGIYICIIPENGTIQWNGDYSMPDCYDNWTSTGQMKKGKAHTICVRDA